MFQELIAFYCISEDSKLVKNCNTCIIWIPSLQLWTEKTGHSDWPWELNG